MPGEDMYHEFKRLSRLGAVERKDEIARIAAYDPAAANHLQELLADLDAQPEPGPLMREFGIPLADEYQLLKQANRLPADQLEVWLAGLVHQGVLDVAASERIRRQVAQTRSQSLRYETYADAVIDVSRKAGSYLDAQQLRGAKLQGKGQWQIDEAVPETVPEGGMGVVLFGHSLDRAIEERGAIKILRWQSDSLDARRRFDREIQRLLDLGNNNRHEPAAESVVKLLDAGYLPDGRPFFVMEAVDGAQTLTASSAADRLNLNARIERFEQVCAAVSFAHQNDVLHRDLKPSNILIDRKGQLKLIDFGIASVMGTEQTQDTSGLTYPYASPQQIEQQEPRRADDIYSLGVVLFELLTGRCPFDNVERGQDLQTRKDFVVRETGLPRDLCSILRKALAFDPADRYAEVEHLSRDLKLFRERRPVEAHSANLLPPARLAYRLRKLVARRWAPLSLAFAVLAGSAVVTTKWLEADANLRLSWAQTLRTDARNSYENGKLRQAFAQAMSSLEITDSYEAREVLQQIERLGVKYLGEVDLSKLNPQPVRLFDIDPSSRFLLLDTTVADGGQAVSSLWFYDPAQRQVKLWVPWTRSDSGARLEWTREGELFHTVAFSPSGELVAVVYSDQLTVYSLSAFSTVSHLELPKSVAEPDRYNLRFAADNSLLINSRRKNGSGHLARIDPKEGRTLWSLELSDTDEVVTLGHRVTQTIFVAGRQDVDLLPESERERQLFQVDLRSGVKTAGRLLPSGESVAAIDSEGRHVLMSSRWSFSLSGGLIGSGMFVSPDPISPSRLALSHAASVVDADAADYRPTSQTFFSIDMDAGQAEELSDSPTKTTLQGWKVVASNALAPIAQRTPCGVVPDKLVEDDTFIAAPRLLVTHPSGVATDRIWALNCLDEALRGGASTRLGLLYISGDQLFFADLVGDRRRLVSRLPTRWARIVDGGTNRKLVYYQDELLFLEVSGVPVVQAKLQFNGGEGWRLGAMVMPSDDVAVAEFVKGNSILGTEVNKTVTYSLGNRKVTELYVWDGCQCAMVSKSRVLLTCRGGSREVWRIDVGQPRRELTFPKTGRVGWSSDGEVWAYAAENAQDVRLSFPGKAIPEKSVVLGQSTEALHFLDGLGFVTGHDNDTDPSIHNQDLYAFFEWDKFDSCRVIDVKAHVRSVDCASVVDLAETGRFRVDRSLRDASGATIVDTSRGGRVLFRQPADAPAITSSSVSDDGRFVLTPRQSGFDLTLLEVPDLAASICLKRWPELSQNEWRQAMPPGLKFKTFCAEKR